MPSLRILSAAEQVADHLREELGRGVWTGKMPGGAALARELGIGRMTADAALELLEKQGVLISQGAGRSRTIALSVPKPTSLRVAVLPLLAGDNRLDYILDIQHRLNEEGHTVAFSDSSISELGSDVKRVAKLVEKTPADAWIVIEGPREVLTWFAERTIPAFALFGRRKGLPIASIGPDKGPAYRLLVRHLLKLGHRRISFLTRPVRRLPRPGLSERAFLDEIGRAGIKTGPYNLPNWDGEIDSLDNSLGSMFRFTPPTALLVDEPPLFYSVQHHLARRGILAPQNISLICTDWDPYFEMQRPSIAHIRWDSRPWVNRVIRWVNHVSQGKDDCRQSLTKAEFVAGGSIGKAP
ncbi:MAG: substrate-binding domain-containing protein [Verrucomicrobiae bacterium]|nr:substrate-binding domain-containing protein [Verrucomicrobiae bacterium]NNJ85669.1 LacI family DNA-binding transcriptional regulator [Akkermansiaceae bacterium]